MSGVGWLFLLLGAIAVLSGRLYKLEGDRQMSIAAYVFAIVLNVLAYFLWEA